MEEKVMKRYGVFSGSLDYRFPRFSSDFAYVPGMTRNNGDGVDVHGSFETFQGAMDCLRKNRLSSSVGRPYGIQRGVHVEEAWIEAGEYVWDDDYESWEWRGDWMSYNEETDYWIDPIGDGPHWWEEEQEEGEGE